MRLAEAFIEVKVDLAQLMSGLDKAQSQLKSFQTKTSQIGKNLSMKVTAPIVAGFGLAIRETANFEQALVELQKVTNKEIATRLGESIKDMSEYIPLTRDELAGLAADTARFGIQGEENILRFTEVVAKMSVATDLSATDAGTALAKLTKLTGTPVEEIENLGSVINELSNTTAGSASEIVDAMLRSSASMKQMGMSNTEIAAINAALNEVSESSQRAGTRLRTLSDTLMDPGKIGNLAEILGMTADEFKKIRDEAPLDLIKQLATVMGEGGEAAGELRQELGSVASAAVGALSENLEGLNTAINTSNTSFKQATSLQKEFEDANSTTYATLGKLWNKLKNVGDTIATVLMPVIEKLIGWVEKAAEWFNGLTDSQKELIIQLTALAAAVGPVLLVISALSGALAALATPVGLVIAGVAALVTAWVTDFGGIKTFTLDFVEKIKGVFNNFKEWFSKIDLLGNLKDVWSKGLENLKTIASDVWDKIKATFNNAVDFLGGIKDKIRGIIDSIGGFIGGILEKIGLVGKKTEDVATTANTDNANTPSLPYHGSRAVGGYIPQTGLYMLHRGENVIPSNTTNNNQQFNPTININISGDGDASAIERAVENALNNSAREFRRTGYELIPGMS